jgi:hypothetical protein
MDRKIHSAALHTTVSATTIDRPPLVEGFRWRRPNRVYSQWPVLQIGTSEVALQPAASVGSRTSMAIDHL